MEYYIILQGKTSIWYRPKVFDAKMKKFNLELNQLPEIKLEATERIKSSFNGVPKMAKLSVSTIKNTQKYGLVLKYNNQPMIKVDTIDNGGFGELSLTEDGVGVRMASILAEEDTHFAVLDKKSFSVSFFHIPVSNILRKS